MVKAQSNADRIAAWLMRFGPATVAQLAEAMGLRPQTVRYHLVINPRRFRRSGAGTKGSPIVWHLKESERS